MSNNEVIKVLNDLIQTSEDGKKGFAEAEHGATQQDLKTMFHQRSTECDAAATELQVLVKSLGGTPEVGGTIGGAAHRGWAKVKATVGDADIGMLEEVERAEDHAKIAYAKALTATLPEQVRTVIQRQHDGAVKNHDAVRDLRNNYKAAKAAHVS